jgi:hypothetical protein
MHGRTAVGYGHGGEQRPRTPITIGWINGIGKMVRNRHQSATRKTLAQRAIGTETLARAKLLERHFCEHIVGDGIYS